MEISPDLIAVFQIGGFTINATIVFTWIVMGLLVITAWLSTRRLSVEPPISHWQNLLEIIVTYIREQIREITLQQPDRYLPFLGTLFLFIAVSNLLAIVPGYSPPTGSLSTTAALAICVFLAVPIFGIAQQGFVGYLRHYSQPTVFMIPFHIINELSRTLSMAVRLFGNIMSGSMILGILLSITPLFVPIVMQVLGMLIGLVQAYIFAVLATVYIASATRLQEEKAQS
ncbi:MAG: F0F1 ATP synthase subunit A [Candidatus Methanoperedens sp.]|nr:F0F1 ATP synthase subunit A [Candidatus Methanoperedens sp.]